MTRARRAARVATGLDSLLARPAAVRGQRLGLIANPTSVTRDLTHASLAMHGTRGFKLVALYGPEHGIWADAQDLVEVEDSRDPRTGLPVHSLYGRTRVPTQSMLWPSTRSSSTCRTWGRATTRSSTRCSTRWRHAPLTAAASSCWIARTRWAGRWSTATCWTPRSHPSWACIRWPRATG